MTKAGERLMAAAKEMRGMTTIPDDEMRVARAILKARFYDCEPEMYESVDDFFEVAGDYHMDGAINEARAAIEAMRPETPDDVKIAANDIAGALLIHHSDRERRRIIARAIMAERERCAKVEEALIDVKQWCDAYPIKIFPEPDLDKARQLLEAGGMTLDSISASAMRHVVTQIGKMLAAAIRKTD